MEGDFGRFVGNVLRVKSKRGRPPVLSAQAFYPMREERELQALLRGELLRSWTASVAEQLERFSDEEASEPFGDGFMEKVWKIADAIIVNAQQSLVKFSEMTIGVPYYPPAVSESVKKDWVDTFQKLCISADTQGKADIATAIYTAKSEGKNKYQVEHEVEQFLPAKTRHRAELIARTETGKLNNAATMATYESAGIRYYRWLATTDERTRPTHAAMNDLICAVGDPDHYYEETPEGLVEKNRTGGMYHGDPGTDFQCRCTSVPWDPRIHGKYDVKEVPEPPENTPSKLEQARAETEAAEQRVQEAERKLRLMTAAVKRHAERTPERVAEIRKLWDDRERKRRIAAILRAAKERHAKRTQTETDDAKVKYWAKHHTSKNMTDAQKIAQAKSWLEIEKNLGIKKGKPMSVAEADEQKANPNYNVDKSYRINCQTCAPAYMLRLWGFDVKAKGNTAGSLSEWLSYGERPFTVWKNLDGSDCSPTFLNDFMSNKSYKKMTSKRYDEFFEESTKEDGVYMLTIGWKGGGGHATILQRAKGSLYYVEPQLYKGNVFQDYSMKLSSIAANSGWNLRSRGILRIDNKIFDKGFISIFYK